MEAQENPKGLAEARMKFDEQNSCAIIGGPIVARLIADREGHAGRARIDAHGPGSYSMFVAISKAPKRGWSSYSSDCVIYELSEAGEIAVDDGTGKSPQMVRGETVAVTNGGIVWAAARMTP